MIWVATFEFVYPKGWQDEQAKAMAIAENCPDEEARHSFLRGNTAADVWKKLRDGMAELSHYKCWYCEVQLTRDDLVIDHYRPKGAVFEDPDHYGYWWLAFQFTNFRLSCKFCNELRVDAVTGQRGGKSTHFPLLPGSVRATAEDRDTDLEMPTILDPCERDDVNYLVFRLDSHAYSKYEIDVDPVGYERAVQTIEYLNLNHSRILRGRAQVCNQVMEAIDRVDSAFRGYARRTAAGQIDPATLNLARRAYTDAVQRLAAYLHSASPYAGAARSILHGARTEDRTWIDSLLTLG